MSREEQEHPGRNPWNPRNVKLYRPGKDWLESMYNTLCLSAGLVGLMPTI